MTRVRARRRGFYGNALRRVGDVFTLEGEHEYSARWMERVPLEVPDSRVAAQGAVDVLRNERPLGGTRRVCWPVDAEDDEHRAITEPFDPFS